MHRHNLPFFGILPDAQAAQRILPQAWPGDPHGLVTVWALYEVSPPPN